MMQASTPTTTKTMTLYLLFIWIFMADYFVIRLTCGPSFFIFSTSFNQYVLRESIKMFFVTFNGPFLQIPQMGIRIPHKLFLLVIFIVSICSNVFTNAQIGIESEPVRTSATVTQVSYKNGRRHVQDVNKYSPNVIFDPEDYDTDYFDVDSKEHSSFEQKVCVGTDDGTSDINVPNYKNNYHRLQKRFENCTVITGNLEITHITQEDINAVDLVTKNGTNYMKRPFWFLKHVREISGYLLIFKNSFDLIPLPRLSIIRGRKLYDGNSLYIASNHITYLNMPNMRVINAGNISIRNAPPNMEYLACKIDLNHFLVDPNNQHIQITRKDCTKPMPCHDKCGSDFCYGPEKQMCQAIYKIGCPGGCDSCYLNRATNQTHCCDKECIGGCIGQGPDSCVACRNFRQDSVCVSECNGIQIYDKQKSMLVDRPKEEQRYFHESYCVPECPAKSLVQEKFCLSQCQNGHYRDVDVDRRTCIPCKGECPKVCTVTRFIDKDMLPDLINCTEIDGKFELLRNFWNEYTPKMLDQFKSIKIVTGYVNIEAMPAMDDKENALESLYFLENLKVIEGRTMRGNNALVVHLMQDLKSLGLKSLDTIAEGGILLTNNSKLCLGPNVSWKSTFNLTSRVHILDNGPKDYCLRENLICDPNCDPQGCWATGPGQCIKCLHFKDGENCVSTCHEEDGYFKPGKTKKNETICQKCHPECITCNGPTEFDCIQCRHYRYENPETRDPQCVSVCPNVTTYPTMDENGDQHCGRCHTHCYGFGCTGPSDLLGIGGCNTCKYAIPLENRTTRCLGGSSTPNACSSHPGFYPEVTHQESIIEGFCHPCREECTLCESLHNCTKCRAYNVIPNNVTDESNAPLIDCALSCGKGNYQVRPQNPDTNSIGICRKCHEYCDAKDDCKGPEASDCNRCQFAMIRGLTGKYCVPSCPDTHPYFYIMECHKYDVETRRRNRMLISIAIGLAVFLFFALVVSYLMYRCRRYRKKFQEEQQMHLPEVPALDPKGITRRANMSRLNIITREELQLTKKVLGSGAFGTVYAGTYKVINAKGKMISVPVAIKVLKMEALAGGNATEAEMIREATLMASLDHKHLLTFIGISFFDGVKLVTALRSMGCLQQFLRKHMHSLGPRDLILYCYQIASAMEHLSRWNIVHCDLAARNVLMRRTNHVEVTDFGLAKLLNCEDASTEKAKVPFKWVPPECLVSRGRFSEASDVWAFGVTCWEIITFGRTPYDDCGISSGQEMYKFLRDGNRLRQPDNCGVHLHGTLISCWSENPETRPKFSDLKETFERYHRVPNEYIQNRQLTQRMDSYTGSSEQQRAQIQRLLSLTDSEMTSDVEEAIYTDQHGRDIVFHPMSGSDFEAPGSVGGSRFSSSSSRYKSEPMRHTNSTLETCLTEVDTDDENYLVPTNSVASPTSKGGRFSIPPIHEYVNENVNPPGPGEYLNIEEECDPEEKPPLDESAKVEDKEAPKTVYVNQAETVL